MPIRPVRIERDTFQAMEAELKMVAAATRKSNTEW